ncbi:glucokinase [Chryseobacterium sp. SNU WT5]|uniref:glucokinase n=1 Tax=Chryseobacterium sp. SNU WT5 TaxID=2594269 RepID=UPI00117FA836|nr:glucokinase [Chryseobacterium sp. SNU WT5]QDP86553.1 glucokinase [Chryseobacterium sp. SNU WT5]
MENYKTISLPDIRVLKLAMAYPSRENSLPSSGTILAADVGGTKTDLALFQIEDGQLISIKIERYPTSDHDSFINAFRAFYGDEISTIDCACFGVAGPVEGNKVHGVNFAWEIDATKLEKELNIKRILLINDLEANAFGLSALEESDFIVLTEDKKGEGNAAIISPGTGLGEAGMYWDGSKYHPYATEGGHCSFGPSNDLDMKLWEYLNDEFDHVSWERVVSGQGIKNIYQFLRKYKGEKEPEWLTEQIKNEDAAIAISSAALENKDSTCVETLKLFLKYLATESAQLALKAKATGGIYIGGGIAPKVLDLIDKNEFYKNFTNVGRMKHLLKTIPVKIVLNDKTALMGAAYYAAMGISN